MSIIIYSVCSVIFMLCPRICVDTTCISWISRIGFGYSPRWPFDYPGKILLAAAAETQQKRMISLLTNQPRTRTDQTDQLNNQPTVINNRYVPILLENIPRFRFEFLINLQL